MSSLFLVRHGQASFGAADYDQLSPLGEQQCRALGEHWRERGQGFEAVYVGGLKRHAQSLAAIACGLGAAALPEAQLRPGLNEYDAYALVRAQAGADWALPKQHDEATRKQHFLWLRAGLQRWMAGQLVPDGMPTWGAFHAGVVAVLDEVRQRHAGPVLVVSSGGPISAALAHVLAAPTATVVALNYQMHNSAVSTTQYNAKRHWVSGFNALPHLDHPERRGWVTLT